MMTELVETLVTKICEMRKYNMIGAVSYEITQTYHVPVKKYLGEDRMLAKYEQTKHLIGQSVCIDWKGKSYYGIVREVSPKGIKLDPLNVSHLVNEDSKKLDVITADKPESINGELSQFGFGFRPFFPFFSPFRISPFFFNPFFFRRRFFFRRPFI
jgi:hypothetical protein